MAVLRSRNAAVLAKIESQTGIYDAPDAATDGVLVENPQIGFNPQNVDTNEVTGSLDGFGPLVGGMQCTVGFDVYLKGSGTPGVAPEWGRLLRACGWSETATRNTIAAATISVTDVETIADSGEGLGPLTVGTVIHVTGFATAANNGEFVVTASTAAAIEVEKLDGSAAGLVVESAGASVTIAYGVAGVAATAGSLVAVTAQAPWSGTAQLYRGMPVVASGNPAVPRESQIADYTSGRVALLADLFAAALDTDTDLSIPANVVYRPISNAIPSLSIAVHMDGVRYKFRGIRGTVDIAMAAGGAWRASFQMTGLLEGRDDAAVPTPSYDGTRPGVWRGSVFSIDRAPVGLEELSFGNGAQTVYPPNPNDAEGFDPPEIVSRAMSGQMNPNAVLTATRDLLADLRAGTERQIHARLRGGNASRPGARLGFIAPTAFLTALQPGDSQGIAREQVGFFPKGQDSGAFIAVW